MTADKRHHIWISGARRLVQGLSYGNHQERRGEMVVSFDRTMESPCRTCEKVHVNKEECSRECVRLQAFQDAIIRYDERNIKDFGIKYGLTRN